MPARLEFKIFVFTYFSDRVVTQNTSTTHATIVQSGHTAAHDERAQLSVALSDAAQSDNVSEHGAKPGERSSLGG